MIEQAQDSTGAPVAPITTDADGPPTPSQSSAMSQSGENLSKTNLYIRGLAPTTTDQDLYNMCSKFGDIVSTKAIQDKTNGGCKGYGFVQFATSDAAETAVNELTKTGVQAQMARVPTHHGPHSKHYSYQNNSSNNSHYHHHPYKHHNNNHHQNNNNNNNNHHGANNHNASGSNVTNNSHSHGANSHSNMNIADPTNLYLANLPLNMTEHELENLLSSYGPVVSTRILRDEKNNPRGVGFARMETRDKCQEIIVKLNGKPYKGSQELLLVKFADGGNRKRHHNNHHHHHHHHHNSAHHKMSHDDNRWHESGDATDQNVAQPGYDHQRNLTHANHMAEMPVMGSMGYPRMQPTFPPTVAANAPYPTAMGPPASADQWIHPSQGQAWNVIPQQMISPNNLGPSSQTAVPSYSYGHMPQLTSQMQGLQLTHHSGAPMSGYIPPHWSHQPVWPHHIPPHQQQTPQSVRPTAPLQPSPTTSSQQQIPQVSTTGATQTSAAKQENPPTDASKQSNSGDTEKQNPASVRE